MINFNITNSNSSSLLYCIILSLTHYLLSKFIFKWVVRKYMNVFGGIPGPKAQSWFTGNLKQLFNPKGLLYHLDLVNEYGGMVKVFGFFGDEQLYISDPKSLNCIIVKEADGFEETELFLETNKAIFGPGLVSTKGLQHKHQRKLTLPIFLNNKYLRSERVVGRLFDVAEDVERVLSDEVRSGLELGLRFVRNYTTNNGKSHGDGEEEGKIIKKNTKIDMSDWMSRFALESVGRTVLSYSFDSLDSKEVNPYTRAIKELIPTIFSLSLLRQLSPFLITLGPSWFRKKLVDIAPIPAVKKLKQMSDVMDLKAKEILKEKQFELLNKDKGKDSDLLGEKGEEGRDVISILVKANDEVPRNERMSDEELTGQMTVLIFGAQDTTSSTLSRILWKLSYRTDIQEKIREEILELRRNKKLTESESDTESDPDFESHDYDDSDENEVGGKKRKERKEKERFSYDELMSLHWLDAVIKETLRMYPPVPFVRRVATRDCVVPYTPSSSSSSTQTQTETQTSHVHIPKGTTLFIGIAASNRLESVWGWDAKEWKPERWITGSSSGSGSGSNNVGSEEKREKEKLPGIYSGMMSFLGGNRSCIGYRFAELEMKIILSVLLTKFTFEPSHEDEIVWNLSQIIAPAVRTVTTTTTSGKEKEVVVEKKGLPLKVGFVRT